MYNLEVHFSVETKKFTVLVPKSPSGEVKKRDYDYSSFDRFMDKDLDEVQRQVREFLKGRDSTEFVDVIEY